MRKQTSQERLLGYSYDADFTGIDANTPLREGVYLIQLSDPAYSNSKFFATLELLNEQRDAWERHNLDSSEPGEPWLASLSSRELGWEISHMQPLLVFISYSDVEVCPTVYAATAGQAHDLGLNCAEGYASDDETPCLIFNLLTNQGPKGDTGDTGPKGDTGDKGDKGDKGDNGDSFPPFIDPPGIGGGTPTDSGGTRTFCFEEPVKIFQRLAIGAGILATPIPISFDEDVRPVVDNWLSSVDPAYTPANLIKFDTVSYGQDYTNILGVSAYEQPHLHWATGDVNIPGVTISASLGVGASVIRFEGGSATAGSTGDPLAARSVNEQGLLMPADDKALITFMSCATYIACDLPNPNPWNIPNPTGAAPNTSFVGGLWAFNTVSSTKIYAKDFTSLTVSLSVWVTGAHGGSGGTDPHIQTQIHGATGPTLYAAFWPAAEDYESHDFVTDITSLADHLDNCGFLTLEIATSGGAGFYRDQVMTMS